MNYQQYLLVKMKRLKLQHYYDVAQNHTLSELKKTQ